MKLAVFGKSGQLSQALRKITSDGVYDAVYFDREDCNLAVNPQNIRKFIVEMPIVDVVVLAAAYTGVEQAETDVQTAFAVNEEAPAIIAEICNKRGMPLIYISTDYVFDGTENTPYRTDHQTNPLNVYGRSKLAGEFAVLNSGAKAAVLRTSWLFNGHGRNFMTTMLKMEESGKSIKVIGDQIGRPTYVKHLAEAVLRVAKDMHSGVDNCSGVFHVTNAGDPVSWAGFAREIFKNSGTPLKSPVIIDEVLTIEYAKKVTRPAYSVLDTSLFESQFNLTLPDWREGLALALKEWRQ